MCMPRRSSSGTAPGWDRLYEIAAAQAGYVSQAQAGEAGYSPQLVQYYVHQGRLERAGRGVLRLVHFPPSDHEDLVVLWLWSEQKGVLSHETALMLHDLSDALPSKRHITVPASWAKRRLRIPRGVELHFADVPKRESAWIGAVPVTAPLRTVVDCAVADVPSNLVAQAARQGVRRGLFERAEVNREIGKALFAKRHAAAKLRKP